MYIREKRGVELFGFDWDTCPKKKKKEKRKKKKKKMSQKEKLKSIKKKKKQTRRFSLRFCLSFRHLPLPFHQRLRS